MVFIHQAPDLLYIHDDALMQEPHVDTACPFGIAAETVGLQYQFEISLVIVFAGLSGWCRIHPGIEAGSGYAGNPAHLGDVQEVLVLPDRFIYDSELYFGWCLDSHCLRASISATCSFFKNSTSWRV